MRNTLRALIARYLHRHFRDWYDTMRASDAWTARRCPYCHAPWALPDARFCAACGVALCGCAATPVERQTSGLLNVSAFPATVYEQSKQLEPEWGPHTRAVRSIRSLKGRRIDG
jgi:hypothetical protein